MFSVVSIELVFKWARLLVYKEKRLTLFKINRRTIVIVITFKKIITCLEGSERVGSINDFRAVTNVYLRNSGVVS